MNAQQTNRQNRCDAGTASRCIRAVILSAILALVHVAPG
jgi:hypothetical protein